MQSTAEIIRSLNAIIEEQAETIRQLRQAAQARAPLPAGLPYLTNNEETVLRALLKASDVVSKETLYRAVYDDDRVEINIVPVFIMRLRRKLPDGYRIVNIRSRGYRLDRPNHMET